MGSSCGRQASLTLALAARETSQLEFGTGLTNSATRHPAAMAAATAGVQVASGGRAHLGIGRPMIVGPSADGDRNEARCACEMIEHEVLLAVAQFVPEQHQEQEQRGTVHVA